MYLLDGDLNQMAIQKSELRARGIKVSQVNVYPAFDTEEDFRKALQAIWNYQIEGWWNYKSEFLKYGICTKEQYADKL